MAMRPRGRTGYLPRQPMRPTYENFKPKSEWKYEDDATRLLVYLPGFVREQIRVEFTYVDNINLAIKVQGQRHLAGGRWSQFIETYEIPGNCDANKINYSFERGLLTIIMPKIVDAKKVSADEENIATPDISSRTSTQEKEETSAMEKQREEKGVKASPKKEKSGREETSLETAALVDTAEKINEKRVESGSESASEKAEEKSRKGPDEVSATPAALADSAERIDGKKLGSRGESATGQSDGKPQGEVSSKTASLADSTEKMDGKRMGSGGESASGKADGKSEKGQNDASTKTAALVDTVEKIDDKKMGSGGESKTIEREMPVEAEKPERRAEKSKEFSSALEAVAPSTEEKETIIKKSGKSVNDVADEQKRDTIVGKLKDIKDESASAAAASYSVSTEGKYLLLNMGTAVLVIMGLGAYISYSLVPN